MSSEILWGSESLQGYSISQDATAGLDNTSGFAFHIYLFTCNYNGLMHNITTRFEVNVTFRFILNICFDCQGIII